MNRPAEYSWPIGEVARALELLARASGLRPRAGARISSPPDIAKDHDAFARWLDHTCGLLNVEAEPAELPYHVVERRLCHAGPALLTIADRESVAFLALVGAGRRWAVLLGQNGRRHRVRIKELAAWLRRELESPLVPMVRTLLDGAGIPAVRHQRAARAILRDHLGPTSISPCWLLRLGPQAPFWQHVRQTLLTRHLLIVVIALVLHACVWVTSWWVLGRAALDGRVDEGTLLAWILLLLMLVPLSLFSGWSQGVVAIGAGGLLKLRLLFGALRLEPDETRHQGVGQHLARVMESEAVESLTLASAFSALATLVELLLVSTIFIAASQMRALALLVVTMLLISALGYVYFRRREQWTEARRRMTQDLVERMVGHRTRLAQEPASHWHNGEDELLERYFVL